MKKIIVPVDFSKHSEYALETAAILAKKNNAELLALHMLELSSAVLTASGTEQNNQTMFYLKLAEQKFDSFLEKDFLEGVNVTPIVKHFKVFKEVSDIAKEHGADLIVMGSHGVSGVKEVFIGSNTEKVVRHSNIPVLIVKEKPTSNQFEKVVFACDFSKQAVAAFINAKAFFSGMDAKLKLLYVNTPNLNFKNSEEMEDRVLEFLEMADHKHMLDPTKDVVYVSDYTIEQGILNYAKRSGADLIAMATHGRKGLSHFFEGSISEDVANHSQQPVITFNMK